MKWGHIAFAVWGSIALSNWFANFGVNRYLVSFTTCFTLLTLFNVIDAEAEK